MIAFLDDLAVIEDINPVGVAHGGETMGDDEAGAIRHEPFERALDQFFGFGIDAGGGLVEKEDGGILEDDTGDGDALLFADGQLHPALADVGLEFPGQGLDEGGGVRGAQGLPHFRIGRITLGEEQILADRSVEEETLLRHVAHGVAEGAFPHRSDGHAVDRDRSGVGLVEAGQQIDHGRFARAGVTDEGDHLAGPRLHRDAFEGGDVVTVGKGHVAQHHVTPHRVRQVAAYVEARLFLRIDHFEDPLSRGAAGLDDLVQTVEPRDRLVEEIEGDEKGDKHPCLGFERGLIRRFHHRPGPEGDNEGVAEIPAKLHRGIVDRPEPHDTQGRHADAVAGGVESDVLRLFAGEGLDLLDAVDVVVEERIHLARLGAEDAVAFRRGLRVGEGSRDEKGHRDHRDEGHFRIEVKQISAHDEHLQEGDEALLDAVDEDPLHRGDILRHTCHHISGAPVVEPPHREPLDLAIQIRADVKDHLLFERIVQDDAERIEEVGRKKRPHREEGERDEPVEIALRDHFPRDRLRDSGEHDHQQGHEDRAGELGRGQQGITFQVGKDPENGFHEGKTSIRPRRTTGLTANDLKE